MEHHNQDGFFVFFNGHYILSKRFRISHQCTCSFEAESVALRVGKNAITNMELSLDDFGYRNVKMELYCDNAPLVATMNDNHLPPKLTSRLKEIAHFLQE